MKTSTTTAAFFSVSTMNTFRRAQRGFGALAIAAAALLASCGSGSGKHHAPAPAQLLSIEVTPDNLSIALGTTQAFTAVGTFSDVTTQDLSEQVSWSSSDSAVVDISDVLGSKGLASALGAGNATITATLSGISGFTALTVDPAVLVAIDVTPTNPQIALGTTLPFVAVGTYSDVSTQDLTSQVLWESSDAAVASVSNVFGENGLGLGLGVGTAQISATLSGISGATALNVTDALLVSIEVTPTQPTIAFGTAQAFTATGTFDDASTQDLTSQALWASSSPAVASISNANGSHGLAQSVGVGATDISAELFGISGSTLLTVSGAPLVSIEVTPLSPSIALGTSVQFVATGTYADNSTQELTAQVFWSAVNPAIATLSNAAGSEGLASSVSAGDTLVLAELAGVSGSAQLSVTNAALVSIEVTPDDFAIALGTAQQFTATGLYTDFSTQDLTAQVTWASTHASVAAISNAAGSNGLAQSLSVGNTSISATLAGKSGATPFAVTNAALVSLDIAPFQPAVANGTELQFAATGTYTDGSTQDLTSQVAWSSSNIAVATISNAAGSHGLASGIGVGSTMIAADFGGASDSTTLDVTNAVLVSIEVTPADVALPLGLTQQYAAAGTFSDATVQDLTRQVTWSSSNAAAAVVSNAAGQEGLASAIAPGAATISATHSGIFGSTTLTILDVALVSIDVSPSSSTLPDGFYRRLSAIGNYSDGSSLDLTKQAVWSSSASSVAKVSNAPGARGEAKGMSVGSTTLSAAFHGVVGAAALDVTNESLSSITLAPAPLLLAIGDKQQMAAIGNFSGGSTVDITAQVNWSSTPKSVASVGNASTKGLVTAKSAGNATIKAKKAGKQGTAVVSVP
ncbi:MAG TPA: Ig-like domain-containing protein [Planctomycetota bacterium]|nr:Ig-like domain-containing protein [Planctomycetota bacterium]